MNKKDPTIVMFEARINFPRLYEPETDGFGRTNYSCELRIYDPKAWDMIEAAKAAAWQKKDSANWQKKLKKTNADPKCCLLRTPDDFDELDPSERFKTMRGTRKPEDGMPKLVGRDRHIVAQSEGLFVSGAVVNVLGQVWAYDNKATGCGFTLLGMQFVRSAPAFGGAPVVSNEDFENLDNGEDDETPDIPF